MRLFPLASWALAALLLAAPGARAGSPSLTGPYPADALGVLGPGRPLQVHALLPPETRWPQAALRTIEETIRQEWPAETAYGPLHTGPEVWLEYPLVTARVGGRVLVPVIPGPELPVRGRLELPETAGGPKRVVILIDASASSNARTRFRSARDPGPGELITVLEAERRSVAHLIERLGDDWLEFGIIAFGESTWPIAPPGTSLARVRERLAEFEREHPRGEGRTDTVCALWTAWDWLREAPEGVEREIVLLTDGDLPHSGRFVDCERLRGDARERCLARANRTTCPAERSLSTRGRSDLIQMSRLARQLRRKVRISPVVFEADRRASAYRDLARRTGGQFVQVPSLEAVDVALPPLVAGRLEGVFAHNLTTGEQSPDLLGPDGEAFSGGLRLAPGANDVELRVESDRGPAALFRFRVYAAEAWLDRYLAELRDRNRTLELEARGLVDEARALERRGRAKQLQIATDD